MFYAYLSLLIFIGIFELFRKKLVFIDFLLLFNIFFVFTYLIPALVFLMAPELHNEWKFLAKVPHAPSSFVVFISVLIAYLSIIFGFKLAIERKVQTYFVLGFRYGEKSQFRLVTILFIISALAFVLYAYGHGGLVSLLLSGKEIRMGRASAGIYQYAKYFSAGLMISMLYYYSFYKVGNSSSRFGSKVLFYAAFVLALLYSVGTAGRGNIGFVFLLVFFYWLNYDGLKLSKAKFFVFSFFVFFIFVLVTYGKSAIWTLGSLADGPLAYIDAFQAHREWYVKGGSGDLISSLIAFSKNLDHGLTTIYLALNFPEVYQSPRLFFDWPRAMLEIIPGINQPEFVVSSTPSGLNRDFLSKDGYVPPGWIAMKIINGGFLWLVIGSVISGYIGGFLNKFLYMSWNESPIVPALFIYTAYFWKDYIVGPDPFMFVLPNLITFLMLLIFSSIFVIKRKKVKSCV